MKSLIVPWDFTERAEAAFQHAIIMAKIINLPITLLHVVAKDSMKLEAEVTLLTDAQRLETKYGYLPQFQVRKGDIYDTINLFSKEIDAPLVVMPLHNSSRAIKVITGSAVPFYLVQAPPVSDKITDIVVPVDHYEENSVQLNWVIFLAKFFKSNINFIKPFIESNSKNDLMKKNMFFVKQLMDMKGIVYGVRTAKREHKFNEAVISFTKEINGSLIFMMTYNFEDFMKQSTKEGCNVPVFCLNPRKVKIVPDKY